jgi:transposase
VAGKPTKMSEPGSIRLGDVPSGESDLTNEEWERIAPLLPPQKPKVGRPASDHRRIVNGILWVVRTGASWRRLPARYGSWRTVASRFYRWRKQGLCDRIFAAIQPQPDADGPSMLTRATS